MATAAQDLSGTREHLSPAQTRALYRLWQRFARLCETPAAYTHQQGLGDGAASSASVAQDVKAGNEFGSSLDGRGRADRGEARRSASTYGKPLQRQPSDVRQINGRGSEIPGGEQLNDELKTLEEAKEMREFLERHGGDKLREIFWDMVKGEHPDAVMLRFLRARKWDVDRAIAVIGSTAAFRADNNVAEILKGGELAITATKGGMNLLLNGVSYIYGASHTGEPIEFFEVGRHFSHNQTQDELKRGVIFLQEYLQIIMPPPVERKVIIFNLNNFGIRNMDWWTVFFMVKTMESYYVETLARVYVHGAPWIFKPIWAILKPLLDPVVRDKILLTDRPEELAEYIPFNHLPKGTMGGGMDWDFEFPVPDPHENDLQNDTETCARLRREYMEVAAEFEKATQKVAQIYARASLMRHKTARAGGSAKKRGALGLADVLSSDEEDDDSAPMGSRRPSMIPSDGNVGPSDQADQLDGAELFKARRDVLATKLRVAFLRLRPYIVGKSMVDRWGVTREDGSMHWRYPTIDGTVEEQTLGMGTTLPELESNLAILEDLLRKQEEAKGKAQHSPDLNDVGGTSSTPKYADQTAAAASTSRAAHASSKPSSPARAREASSGTDAGSELNRRQQRLVSRMQSQSLLDDPSVEQGNGSVVAADNEEVGASAAPVPASTEKSGTAPGGQAAISQQKRDTITQGSEPVPVHPLNSPGKTRSQLPDA